jgi:hypothetical protein
MAQHGNAVVRAARGGVFLASKRIMTTPQAVNRAPACPEDRGEK